MTPSRRIGTLPLGTNVSRILLFHHKTISPKRILVYGPHSMTPSRRMDTFDDMHKRGGFPTRLYLGTRASWNEARTSLLAWLRCPSARLNFSQFVAAFSARYNFCWQILPFLPLFKTFFIALCDEHFRGFDIHSKF